MSDLEPLPSTPPRLEINPSAIRALILMLVRVVSIVATAVGVLVAFVQTRDLAGFIVWIKSDDFLQFCTALGLLVSLGSSAYVTLSHKWREAYLGRHVGDNIAIVKEAKPAPSVEALPVAPSAD